MATAERHAIATASTRTLAGYGNLAQPAIRSHKAFLHRHGVGGEILTHTFFPQRKLIMLKLFTVGLLASTLGLSSVDAAQACCRARCCAPRNCASNCTAPAATAAPMGHEDHAAPAPPAGPQANAETYRRFSYEPTVPAAQYRTPARSQTPSYFLPKTDSRRFNGGW
jgi:hypothetical protein